MTLDLHGLFRPKTLALSSRATKKEGDPFALEQVESKTNQRNEEKEGDPLPSSRRSRKRTNNEMDEPGRRQATHAHEISMPTNLRSSQHRNGHDKQLKTMNNNQRSVIRAQQFGNLLSASETQRTYEPSFEL